MRGVLKSRVAATVAVAMFLFVSARADVPSFYSRYSFLGAASGVYEEGLVGFANPANLVLLHRAEFRFHWQSKPERLTGRRNWGLYSALPGLGFSAQRQRFGPGYSTDYRMGFGFGTRASALGVSYGWTRASGAHQPAEHQIAIGLIERPNRYISLGVTAHLGTQTGDYEYVGEIGIRPIGRRLTLFADAAWHKDVKLDDVPWSAGAIVGIAPGIDVTSRYFESRAFTVGVRINVGRGGVVTQSHFGSGGDFAYQSHGYRTGGLKAGLLTGGLVRDRYYLPLDPAGRVRYLKYRFLDPGSTRFYDILKDIESAVSDPRVMTIAINLSHARMAPEHAWEIREALLHARRAGKLVVVFIENAGMTAYHLASVGNHVVLDPMGMVLLEGYQLNKTYLQGTMAKLGLTFDAWRFYKYKSAAESLVRKDMSKEDREQNQAFVDDLYEQTRQDVCASRSVSTEQFDAWIDDRTVFLADSALALGLVDTLGRWSDVRRIVEALSGRSLRPLGSDQLLATALQPEEWGAPPRIALVYAIGPCAMESGIRARWLERVFLGLANDKSVSAVVFRVDSPGGEVVASDLVSAALRKCSDKKPVIVSQGQVAASGGYWISMNADAILAGPTTVTGSIGVIGGWLYDSGMSDHLGMTSDHVKRGAHADVNSGVTLPLLGIRIPSRNLTSDERELAERAIRTHYATFIRKVALGRGMTEEEVSTLAQGRIWSGSRAVRNGLIDEVGGLMGAFALARSMAGLSSDEEIDVVEYPKSRGFIKWPWRTGIGLKAPVDDEWTAYLKMLGEAKGRALPLLAPGSYPVAE